MALTMYQLTVAIQDDPDGDGEPERELAAQLRLAAHAVAAGSAPVPGDPPKLLVGGDTGADHATVYLSAVGL